MSAEEMFKNKGFRKLKCYKEEHLFKYKKIIYDDVFKWTIEVYFIEGEKVSVCDDRGLFGALIDIELLKAINQQCKELGWLDDKEDQELAYSRYIKPYIE